MMLGVDARWKKTKKDGRTPLEKPSTGMTRRTENLREEGVFQDRKNMEEYAGTNDKCMNPGLGDEVRCNTRGLRTWDVPLRQGCQYLTRQGGCSSKVPDSYQS